MDRREELCNSAPEDETVMRERKRLRRVSFAENTEVHVFDRDEEYSSTPPLPPPSPQDYPQLSLLRQDSTEDDDDQHQFLRAGSPGSAVSSANSNDEEDNFFGPVSPSFIRLGGQFDSSVASDDHDITLDSTAFSMHYQSLAHSDSSAATCKTPTPSFQGKNSDSRSFMVMTEVKKHIPFDSFSGTRDSNEMKLIANTASDKYDYGKLSPALEEFVAQLGRERDHASLSDHMSVAVFSNLRNTQEDEAFQANKEGGGFSGGRDSKDTSLVRKSPSSNCDHPRQSPAFVDQPGKDKDHDYLSKQIGFPMSSNNLYIDSKVEVEPSKFSQWNNTERAREPHDTNLIQSSPSGKYDKGRLYANIELPPAESRNGTLMTAVSNQMSVLKPPNRLSAESNIELPSSKAKEFNTVEQWESTDGRELKYTSPMGRSPTTKHDFGKLSATMESQRAESGQYRLHASISEQTSTLKPSTFLHSEASRAPELDNSDRGDSTHGRDSDGMMLIRNTPSRQYNMVNRSPTLKPLQAENRSYVHHASLSDQTSALKSPIRLNTESKLEYQAFEAAVLNNNGKDDSTSAHDPMDTILFRNSPSKPYYYGRTPPSVETLKVKSRNYTHHASVSDQMNVLNSLNHLNSDSKVEELCSSRAKEMNNIHTRVSSGVHDSDDTSLVKLSPISESLLSPRRKDTDHVSVSDQEKSPIFELLLSPRRQDLHQVSVSDQEEAHGVDKSHDRPPFSPCHLLQPFQNLSQPGQINITKSSNSLNPDSKVEVSHTSTGAAEKPPDARDNPAVTRVSLSEVRLDHCPRGNNEVAKTGGYASKGRGANVLKEIPGAVEKVLSPSTEKLNNRELDILEDMLGRMQNALKYEKLSSLVQFQRTRNPLGDDHQIRIAKAKWLQDTLIYEQAKLVLLRIKQERLCKKIQLVQSGIEETQELRLGAKKILENYAKETQSKDATLPSALVDLSSETMDKCDEVTERRKELESLDMKVKNLTKSLLASCKIKEETSFDESLVVINEHLREKKRCRLLQRNLQLYEVDRLERENGHCNLVLNYHSVLHQSFRMSHDSLPKLVTCNQLNTVNIMKSFPNMNAGIAFAFVFDEVTQNLVSSKCLAVKTQMIRSRLHNLLMVVGEVQHACIDLRSLIQTRFCSSRGGLLELEICFMDFKTGNKATLVLDVTCLNRGVYPLDIHPQISVTPVSESLSAEIRAAIEALKVGYSMIHRLCVCVAQVVDASSR